MSLCTICANGVIYIYYNKMYLDVAKQILKTVLYMRPAFNVFVGRQVLDACQFLHHRGIVHLNLQPDAVIMESRRRFDVKLVDFGRSRNISSYDGQPVPREGMTEFMGRPYGFGVMRSMSISDIDL